MRTVYQNVDVEGINLVEKRKNSKFWNEGKWNNFIKPYLPENCSDMGFMEFGSSAGMFLKFAEKMGFDTIMGIEASRREHYAAVKYKRDSKYKLLFATLDSSFNIDSLPVVDFILMSNFHYHLYSKDLASIIDRIRYKTRYCIVVSSDEVVRHPYRAQPDLVYTRGYFNKWKQLSFVPKISSEGDPCPRDMWSVMFESPLIIRVEMDKIWQPGLAMPSFTAVENLAKEVIEKDKIENIESVDYYNELVNADGVDSDKAILQTKNAINNMYDFKNNYIKEPISITGQGRLLDGRHRMSFLKAKGHKSILARII